MSDSRSTEISQRAHGAPSSTAPALTLASVTSPNALYAATGTPPAAVFGLTDNIAMNTPAGSGDTPPATSDGDHLILPTATLAFTPKTIAPAVFTPGSRNASKTTPIVATAPNALVSQANPANNIAGLIGGAIAVFISNGDEPGENGGWLIGNGADGGPGQDGGHGGRGGDGDALHRAGGNGGNGGVSSPGGAGGPGGSGTGAGGFGGNGGNGGHPGGPGGPGSTSDGTDG